MRVRNKKKGQLTPSEHQKMASWHWLRLPMFGTDALSDIVLLHLGSLVPYLRKSGYISIYISRIETAMYLLRHHWISLSMVVFLLVKQFS